MSFETIQFAAADGVATLTLNRPAVMNALNTRMRAEITQALTTLAPDVRAVVMTGAGRGFCSGQDLTDAGAAADLERTLREEYEPMLAAVTGCAVAGSPGSRTTSDTSVARIHAGSGEPRPVARRSRNQPAMLPATSSDSAMR